MKAYRLDQSKIEEQKKPIILMYGITGVVLVGIALAMNWGKERSGMLLWMIPLLIGFYIFMGVRAYNQRKAFIEGYSLEVDEEGITQNQPKYPELRIPRADITNLEERKNGIILSVKQGKNVLGIPKELMKPEDFAEIRETLTGWVAENTRSTRVIDVDDEDVDVFAVPTDRVSDEVSKLSDDAAEVVDDVKEGLDEAADKAAEAVDEAGEAVAEQMEEAAEAADDFKDDAVDAAEEAVDEAAEVVDEAGEAVAERVEEAAEVVEDAKDAVVDAAEDVVDGAAEVVEDAKDAVVDAAEDVVDGASEVVGDVVREVDEFVDDVEDELTDPDKPA